MPMEAYKAMKDTIESPDESVPFENVLNVAMPLFMNYVYAATDSIDMEVFAFCRAVTRAEGTVLKVEMTDECLTAIKSAREELIKAETTLLASHRRLMIQELRNQNEEMRSFIKSCQGVFLSPKVLWWWACISYATSLYSLWCLLQMVLQWLKY